MITVLYKSLFTYLNTKQKQKKTALAKKTNYTLVWYALYNLRSGNKVGHIFTSKQPVRVI